MFVLVFCLRFVVGVGGVFFVFFVFLWGCGSRRGGGVGLPDWEGSMVGVAGLCGRCLSRSGWTSCLSMLLFVMNWW